MQVLKPVDRGVSSQNTEILMGNVGAAHLKGPLARLPALLNVSIYAQHILLLIRCIVHWLLNWQMSERSCTSESICI